MQAPTQNRITQKQHLASKAVDHSDDPNPYVYASEDGVIDSYKRRGSGKLDAGNCLRLRGKTGLHQYAHLEESYVKVGQKVKRGQKLAKMGHTGYTIPAGPNGRHLHYWIYTGTGYKYPPNLYKDKFRVYVPKPKTVTVKAGWGLSQVAKAAGYKDWWSPSAWIRIARKNGYGTNWVKMNRALKPKQKVKV